MYDTILVATDGSDAADRAADHAGTLASTFGADLHAIHVVNTARYGKSVLSGSDDVLEALEKQGRDVLETVSERADVAVRTKLLSGQPDTEIDAYAEEIDSDLIVIGNRGLGAGAAGQIGSVAERIVRTTDRPVITC